MSSDTTPVSAGDRSGEARPDGARRFVSHDPATGEVVAEHPIDDRAAVEAAVGRARAAAVRWAALAPRARRRRLGAWKGVLARRAEELAALVTRENGKPREDAVAEVLAGVNSIAWAAANAHRVLADRRVPSSLVAINHSSRILHHPLGVIGVIGPWNYPVSTPMGLLAFALATGNAVVFKPSEFTPAVGRWLADAFTEAVPEQPVFQVVTGLGETGADLCAAGVDKLAFTGSAATGRRIMAACADTLTPVLLELGGNDAMIVAEDADVDAAARTAVWGALQNAGQGCISIERAFVVEAVHDHFVARVAEYGRTVRTAGPERQIGPITMPRQVEAITRHLDDAFARGGRAIVGGPGGVRAPFIDPVIVTDLPDDALMMADETFGPTLAVRRVADVDEAVRQANATPYGLGSAVFASPRHGLAIARRLRAGMTAVNSAIAYSFNPALPFGGVGASGFGRKHGLDGLREFVRPHAVTVKRFDLPVDPQRFDRPPGAIDRALRLAQLLHGRG